MKREIFGWQALALAGVLVALPGTGHAIVMLHDNGGIVTGTGNGWSGANTSVWQNVTWTIGGSTATVVGLGNNVNYFRVVDDFVVPEGQKWRLDSLSFVGLRSFSSSAITSLDIASPFTGVHFAVYSSESAMMAGTPQWGDWSTNRLRSTQFMGAFRVAASQLTNRQRPLFEIAADAQWLPELSSGRYWVEWGFSTPNAAANTEFLFTPPVTPHTVGGNAWQRDALTGTRYNLDPLELPFQVRGSVVPEPATWTLGLGLAALLRRRARTRRASG